MKKVFRRFTIALVFAILLQFAKSPLPTTSYVNAQTNCPSPGLYNATDRFDRPNKSYGVHGNISYTNPNLNGGIATYARVINAIALGTFTEIGWVKDTQGTAVLIAYTSTRSGR
jgi:hypothetical protein